MYWLCAHAYMCLSMCGGQRSTSLAFRDNYTPPPLFFFFQDSVSHLAQNSSSKLGCLANEVSLYLSTQGCDHKHIPLYLASHTLPTSLGSEDSHPGPHDHMENFLPTELPPSPTLCSLSCSVFLGGRPSCSSWAVKEAQAGSCM